MSNVAKNGNAVNKEHVDLLVGIFKKIRIEDYAPDGKEYALFTRILKNKPFSDGYDIDNFKMVLEYFEKYGLRLQKGNLYSFFHHAFQYPDVAMQPYNTIDLKTNKKGTQEKDPAKKIIQPTTRKEYEKEFKGIKDDLIKQMEEHAKSGTPIDTGYNDEELSNSSPHIGCSKCISGYIEREDGTWDYCDCYKKEVFRVKMVKAGIPKDYFYIDSIDTNNIEFAAKKMFGQDKEKFNGVNINITLKNYIDNIEKIKEDGWNLLFEGPTGSAKTTSACICAKGALKHGYSVLFTEVQKLRKIWTGEKLTPELEKLKEDLYTVDFLILDDLGQEFLSSSSEHQISEMDLLFRERSSEKKCTIITTNSSQDKIKERYQERIFSLLKKKTVHIFIKAKKDLREQEELPDFL